MSLDANHEVVLDREHETVPAFSDVCNFCRHYQGMRTCSAFPNGIPLTIWLEENNHLRPYPGDHGIQYEAVETHVDILLPIAL